MSLSPNLLGPDLFTCTLLSLVISHPHIKHTIPVGDTDDLHGLALAETVRHIW